MSQTRTSRKPSRTGLPDFVFFVVRPAGVSATCRGVTGTGASRAEALRDLARRLGPAGR